MFHPGYSVHATVSLKRFRNRPLARYSIGCCQEFYDPDGILVHCVFQYFTVIPRVHIAVSCPVVQIVAFVPSFPWDIVKNLVIISITLKEVLFVYHNAYFFINFYPMPSGIPFDIYTEDS